MQRRMWATLGAGLLGLLLAGPGRADFIITVGNLSLPQNSSGFLAVTIQSTVAGGEPLDFTAFEYRITTSSGRLLEFQNSPAPSSDPTFANPNYVFFGDSLDQMTSSPLGTAFTTTTTNDSFMGGDLKADPPPALVPAAPSKLLAELPVSAVTALVGDTFTISLVPSSGAGFSGNTGFAADGVFAPFTSIPGTVTITPAVSAVPEPASVTLALIGAGLAGLAGWRRRR